MRKILAAQKRSKAAKRPQSRRSNLAPPTRSVPISRNSGEPSVQSLREQIDCELTKLCSKDEALAWLISPQQVLGLRIPARMMAIGEGRAVLKALHACQAPHSGD